jgi:hypothetical protein
LARSCPYRPAMPQQPTGSTAQVDAKPARDLRPLRRCRRRVCLFGAVRQQCHSTRGLDRQQRQLADAAGEPLCARATLGARSFPEGLDVLRRGRRASSRDRRRPSATPVAASAFSSSALAMAVRSNSRSRPEDMLWLPVRHERRQPGDETRAGSASRRSPATTAGVVIRREGVLTTITLLRRSTFGSFDNASTDAMRTPRCCATARRLIPLSSGSDTRPSRASADRPSRLPVRPFIRRGIRAASGSHPSSDATRASFAGRR